MQFYLLPALATLLLACPAASAQSSSGNAIRVDALEYNTVPEGLPLTHFSVRAEVSPPGGGAYTLLQTCDTTCIFDQIPAGSDVTFTAFKEDEPGTAVSAYDLVLISQHINQVEFLSHPGLLIAADADCNGRIETKDIVILRSMLLGIDTTTCRPWTLLNAATILPPDPLGAPLPREIVIRDYNGYPLNLGFWAIKTGNVNAYPPALRTLPPAGVFVTALQPNPTAGPARFTVQLNAAATFQLELFDTSGRLLYTLRQPAQAGAQEFELPAEALPMPGVYFWQASAAGEHAKGKLVRI